MVFLLSKTPQANMNRESLGDSLTGASLAVVGEAPSPIVAYRVPDAGMRKIRGHVIAA
jgi:hypothetical protein